MKHKFLILGSNGFIGKALTKKLPESSYATFSVKPQVLKHSTGQSYVYPDDTTLIQYLQSQSFTHLLFFAWPQSPPHNTIEQSLFASFAINFCRLFSEIHSKGRIYFLGSIHETGFQSGLVLNSFENCRPKTLYGQAKKFVWDSLKNICPDNLCWIRLSNIYGPNDHQTKVIHLMIKAIISGENFVLNNPKAFIDYVHIQDAIEGIDLAIKHNYTGLMNIGSGQGYHLYEIQDFLNTLDSTFKQYTTAVTGPILDISLAKQELGYSPKISITQGLSELLEQSKRSNHYAC